MRLLKGTIRRLGAPAYGRRSLERLSVAAESLLAGDRERLLVVDDFFPCLATAFRVAEFNSILERFKTAVVYSAWPERRAFSEYRAHYPQFAGRVRSFHSARQLKGAAAYVVFLNNIYRFLDNLELARLPFVVELYPGGGFYLDEPVSNAHLERVLASPMFRKAIVTQNVTRDYLLRKNLCPKDRIEFIFGVVAPFDSLGEVAAPRFRYALNKDTIDICFVANKYMPGGLDKGYDRFLKSAAILSRRYSQARFHIVGNFREEDGDITELRDRITFYGHRPTEFFPDFHSRMDLILSPNIPFVFAPGAFDGFPTGCCIEAALCGTAVFAADELGMNEGRLRDGEEIVTISREPDEIAEIVGQYIANPTRLASLAQNGQRAIRRLFSVDAQMIPRLRVLSDLLGGASLSP
jgi:glycosyltransferase involved in cell wall biosynthesis